MDTMFTFKVTSTKLESTGLLIKWWYVTSIISFPLFRLNIGEGRTNRAVGEQSGGFDQPEHTVPETEPWPEAGHVLEEREDVPADWRGRLCKFQLLFLSIISHFLAFNEK